MKRLLPIILLIFLSACSAEQIAEPQEEPFCGFSTDGACETDADCRPGGCSGQVCESVNEESIATICDFRECYVAENYGLNCGCVEQKCQWS